MAITDDGRRVIVGTWSGVIALFEPPREQPLAVLVEGGLVASGVAFTPDGRTAVGAVSRGALRRWDARTGVEQPSAHPGNLAAPDGIAWAADGHRAIVAGGASAAFVWDMRCGEHTANLEGHRRRVRQVAASADGRRIATGGNDGWVRLWNGETLERLHEAQDHHGPVSAVSLSADGRVIASGGRGGSILVRDTERAGVIFERPAEEGADTVISLALAPTRGLLLAGDVMGAIAWIDMATGATLALTEVDYPSNLRSIAFSPDGARVATAASDKIRIYDTATATNTFTFAVPGWTVTNPAWFRDGERLAFGDSDGHLWIVDAAAGRMIREARIEDQGIVTLSVHPKEGTILTGHADTTMKLWDVEALGAPTAAGAVEVIAPPAAELAKAHPLPESAARQCPSGDRTLPACAQLRRGRDPFYLEDRLDDMGVLRFSSDGKLLAAGGGEAVEILELPSGRVRQRLVCCMAAPVAAMFSPDARSLAITPWAQKTQVWDLGTGRQRGVWSESAVVLAVSSDGSTWAGATRAGEIFIGDGDTLTPLTRASDGSAPVRSLALSSTGKYLLAHRPGVDVELWNTRERRRLWSLAEDDAAPTGVLDAEVSAVAFGEGDAVVVVAGDHRFERRGGAWSAQPVPLSYGDVVECGAQGKICVEPTERGLGLARLGEPPRELKAGDVDRFAVSADGAWAAVAGGYDLALWDLARGQRQNTPALAPPKGIALTRGGALLTRHEAEVRWWKLGDEAPSAPLGVSVEAAATSRDGHVVVAHDGRELFVVPAAGGARRVLETGRFEGIPRLTDSGRHVAAVRSEGEVTEVVVIEVATGKLVWRHPLADGARPRVALSSAGDAVAVSDGETLEIWSVGGARRARVDVEHEIRAMDFMPDGAAIITAGSGHLERYASGDGAHLGLIGDHASVWAFDRSEDGRLLISGGLDRQVRVFDLQERRLLAVLAGHGHHVDEVTVAGDTAVTLGRDGTLIAWDLRPFVPAKR